MLTESICFNNVAGPLHSVIVELAIFLPNKSSRCTGGVHTQELRTLLGRPSRSYRPARQIEERLATQHNGTCGTTDCDDGEQSKGLQLCVCSSGK